MLEQASLLVFVLEITTEYDFWNFSNLVILAFSSSELPKTVTLTALSEMSVVGASQILKRCFVDHCAQDPHSTTDVIDSDPPVAGKHVVVEYMSLGLL